MTQLSDRRLSLGGSDAAAAIGISPWKTRVQLWLEKKGLAAPDDITGNDAVYWGTALESLILDEYQRRTGNTFVGRSVGVRSTEWTWMTGTLDGLAAGGRIVEAKTAGERSAHLWGPDGSDEMPREYLAQLAHYMLCTGYEVADLAVLIGGRDFRVLTVSRDSLPLDGIARSEAEFWRSLDADDPPAPELVDDCRRLWPADDGARLVAADDVALACAELADLKARIKELEQERAGAELFIQSAMRGAAELADTDGRLLATWKAQKSSRVDVTALAKQRPEIAAEFRRETTSRVFRLKGERA